MLDERYPDPNQTTITVFVLGEITPDKPSEFRARDVLVDSAAPKELE